jgi:hypothetical protein
MADDPEAAKQSAGGVGVSTVSQAMMFEAVRTLLGSLPMGCEMKFYWHDGHQCFEFVDSKGASECYRLCRRDDGCGTIQPATSRFVN